LPLQRWCRFPPPWKLEQIPGDYKVIDANGRPLAYVYGRETRADPDTADVLSKLPALAIGRGFFLFLTFPDESWLGRAPSPLCRVQTEEAPKPGASQAVMSLREAAMAVLWFVRTHLVPVIFLGAAARLSKVRFCNRHLSPNWKGTFVNRQD
jgi:hypothetical protein